MCCVVRHKREPNNGDRRMASPDRTGEIKVHQDQIGQSKIRQKQHVEAIAEPGTDKKVKRTGGRVNDPTACGCSKGAGKGEDLSEDESEEAEECRNS